MQYFYRYIYCHYCYVIYARYSQTINKMHGDIQVFGEFHKTINNYDGHHKM